MYSSIRYFVSLYALLLYADVASNWLACFPFSARNHVFDIFFVNGLAIEVVQTLVPCLQQNGSDDADINAVNSNAERYGSEIDLMLYFEFVIEFNADSSA